LDLRFASRRFWICDFGFWIEEKSDRNRFFNPKLLLVSHLEFLDLRLWILDRGEKRLQSVLQSKIQNLKSKIGTQGVDFGGREQCTAATF
jgi:hypothetical protein